MPFFTLLDPRAKIKGSRDPLGFQSIWTRLGRQVIQNLTTVTTSVRGFSTLLLGLYFAEQMVTQANLDEADISNIFLKFEQLAAYSRVAYNGNLNDELDILGIRRVKRNLQDKRGAVRISAHQNDQILSNQKTYGLWGLYTVAARNSGLIEPGYARLTPIARDFVEAEYLPRLNHVTQSLYAFLTKEQMFEPTKKQASLGATLANLLGSKLTPSEISFYTHHLLYGGEKNTLQQRLWEQIKAIIVPDPFSMAELKEVIHRCHKMNDDSLALRLMHIRQVEQVIAPAGYLFGFLLSRDGQTGAHVADEVKQTWGSGLSHLDPTAFGRAVDSIEDVDPEVRTRLGQLAEALQMGQYELALDLCLAQNKEVMKERGSQPWLTLKNRQFDVRLREEADWLPAKAELPGLWVNTYFINSLKFVGSQLQ
jgi:hypothetical protein